MIVLIETNEEFATIFAPISVSKFRCFGADSEFGVIEGLIFSFSQCPISNLLRQWPVRPCRPARR